MFEYKSEVLKIPYKAIKESIDETQLARLDELFNMRAEEGWELVTHSISGFDDVSYCKVIATFRKEK